MREVCEGDTMGIEEVGEYDMMNQREIREGD